MNFKNKSNLIRLSLIISIFSFLYSCAKPTNNTASNPNTTPHTTTNQSPIINGVKVGERNDKEGLQYSTVSLIAVRATSVSGCTATIVRDNYLLTARHCFTGGLKDNLPVDPTVNKYFVVFSTQSMAFNHLTTAEFAKRFFSDKKSKLRVCDNTNCSIFLNPHHDIALLKFNNFSIPTELSYKKVAIFDGEAPKKNASIKILGYGVRPENRDEHTKKEILKTDPVTGLSNGDLYATDAKFLGYGTLKADLAATESLPLPAISPSPSSDQILTNGIDKPGTCHSDSGGPIYIKNPSTTDYQLMGVASWWIPLVKDGKAIDGSCDTKIPARQVSLMNLEIRKWLLSCIMKNKCEP